MNVQHFTLKAEVQHMSDSDIATMVGHDTLSRIKAKDEHPLIKVYGVGQEGEAKGKLVGLGTQVIQYLQHAIVKLGDRLRMGTKVFSRHADTNTHDGREEIGEVVGKTIKTIGGKLSALAAIYIAPKFKDVDLDVASIEAEAELSFDSAGNAFVDDFQNITGIALSNHNIDTPGFPGATLMGALQAFTESNPRKGALQMSDKLTVADIKKAISDGGHKVTDFFDKSAILSLPEVVEHVRKEKQEEYEHAKRVERKLGEEREAQLEKEKEWSEKESKFKQEAAKISSTKLLETVVADRKLDDRQKAFVTKNLGKFEPDTSGDDANKRAMDKWMDGQLTEFKELATLITGKEPSNEDPKPQLTPTPSAGTEGDPPLPEMMDPAKNPYIPKL